MRYTELTESVTDHLEMADAAEQAALAVCRKLYQGLAPDHYVDIEGYGPFFIYDFGHFGLHAIPGMAQYCLMLGTINPSNADQLGGEVKLDPPLFDYDRAVVVFGLKASTLEAVKDMVSTSLLSTLKHEFIHVYDTLRNPKIASASSANQRQYYNSPAEFHAYMHEVMERLTSIAREHNPELRKFLAQSNGITGDFKSDLAMMLNQNQVTSEFVSGLRAARRKALLKRVYLMYQHVMELLKQPATQTT
jgi:hypothetical protein